MQRLGGDRSIQLSYGGLYRKYSILQDSRIRTIRFLGGDRSIQLSYEGLYREYSILQDSWIRTIRLLGIFCSSVVMFSFCSLPIDQSHTFHPFWFTALDRSKHQHHFPTFIFQLYFPSKSIAIVCIPCATAFSHSSILTINGKERFSNTHWEHL